MLHVVGQSDIAIEFRFNVNEAFEFAPTSEQGRGHKAATGLPLHDGGMLVGFKPPLPGMRMEDCDPIQGDVIAGVVNWQGKADVSKLAGGPVRLRFVMNEADVFSIRFPVEN